MTWDLRYVQFWRRYESVWKSTLLTFRHEIQALSSYVFIAANVILHASQPVQHRHLNELLPPIVPLLTSHHHSLRGFTQVGYCKICKIDYCISYYIGFTYLECLCIMRVCFAVAGLPSSLQIVPSHGFWSLWMYDFREEMFSGSEILPRKELWLYAVWYLKCMDVFLFCFLPVKYSARLSQYLIVRAFVDITI